MRKTIIVLIGIIVLSVGLNAKEQNLETLKPFYFDVGFGIDIFVEENASIYFDYTGLVNILENKKIESGNFNPKFQMGIRYCF